MEKNNQRELNHTNHFNQMNHSSDNFHNIIE